MGAAGPEFRSSHHTFIGMIAQQAMVSSIRQNMKQKLFTRRKAQTQRPIATICFILKQGTVTQCAFVVKNLIKKKNKQNINSKVTVNKNLDYIINLLTLTFKYI